MEHEIVRGIKETGVKRIRIHDLRHSHASLLMELGFQPLAIAERLRHEKIEATLNNEIFEMADKQGISKRTLENAKKELGIRAKKINNSWYWELDAVKQR